MNHKDKATKDSNSGEKGNSTLEGIASNLSNSLTRVGSVFKELFRSEPQRSTPRTLLADTGPKGEETVTPTPPPQSAPASATQNRNHVHKAETHREQVEADHAWIRQNLERRFRTPAVTTTADKLPPAEPMDEDAIRARLLKIHGGRLPGRSGRQGTPVVEDAPVSTVVESPVEASGASDDRSPEQAILPRPLPLPGSRAAKGSQGTLTTSSKPRASVVKPVPANLRNSLPSVESEISPLVLSAQQPPHDEEFTSPSHWPNQYIETIEVKEPSDPSFLISSIASPIITVSPAKSARKIPQRTTDNRKSLPPYDQNERNKLTSRQPISASITPPRQQHRAFMEAKAPANTDVVDFEAPNLNSNYPEASPPVQIDTAGSLLTVFNQSQTDAGQGVQTSAPDVASYPPVKPRISIRPTLSLETSPLISAPTSADDLVSTNSPCELLIEDRSRSVPPDADPWADYAPPIDLLQAPSEIQTTVTPETLTRNGQLIEEKLAEYRVKVAVHDAFAGPVITRYEVEPAVGVRGAQVVNLMKDLARALSVTSIRIVETIPGKTFMGLELPNAHRQMIRLSEVLTSDVFRHHSSKLAMALGKDITGEPVVADLAKAPHMLVAGTTGSGKSVGVNAMILSLLYRATPEEVRFVMIDPKMLELSVYDGIPHLLAPVVTDMKLAANALHWCVTEMERRYRLMSLLGVRNLSGFNQKVQDSQNAGRPIYDPEPLVKESPTPLSPLPFIVVVVDEFADLMMVAGKKIEELIARLAQKARAAGIHLVLATQRPSVDVITGLIKANIPTRIAFQVSSKVDSRTILDQMGAETLLGQGDMLYLPPGTGYPQRVHGAFVADDEVHRLAEHLKQYGTPDYVDAVLGTPESNDTQDGGTNSVEENDPLYDQAVAIVIESRRASISLVQRHLRIGYNRAARLVEQMEVAGIVSPMESNGSRTVLVPSN